MSRRINDKQLWILASSCDTTEEPLLVKSVLCLFYSTTLLPASCSLSLYLLQSLSLAINFYLIHLSVSAFTKDLPTIVFSISKVLPFQLLLPSDLPQLGQFGRTLASYSDLLSTPNTVFWESRRANCFECS